MLLGDIIKSNARRFPNHLSFVYRDTRLTFKQYDERTNRLANALLGLGAQKGDRICVILGNCHQYLEIAGAAWKAGMVVVPISIHLKQELISIFENATPNSIFTSQDYLDNVILHKDLVKNIICIESGGDGILDYEHLIAKAATSDPIIDIEKDDLSTIFYTSGTTGMPKGVCNTHERQIKSAEYHLLTSEPVDYNQSRPSVVVHPLYFNTPLNCTIIPSMLMANPVVFLESFSPQAFLKAVEKERITDVIMVPTMVSRLLEYPDLHKYDFSSLKLLGYGSAPMPTSLLKRAIEVFGNIFAQGYGLTETLGAVTVLPVRDHVVDGPAEVIRRLSSCGRERIDTWIKVVRADGTEINRDENEIGEIIIKCESTMKGYFKKPELTAETIKGSWLYSGDMATMDEDGYIYIKDRKTDMIISGAINIYPWEVEDVIYSHPEVLEAAVIGKPDDEWGEIVKAYIVLRPESRTTEEEIIQYVKDRLATYKKPKEVAFVDALPHSPAGKILRRELKTKELKKS